MGLCEPGRVLSVWKTLPEFGMTPLARSLVFVCGSPHFVGHCSSHFIFAPCCQLCFRMCGSVPVCFCVYLHVSM